MKFVVSVILLVLCSRVLSDAVDDILVDQAGYALDMPKYAVIKNAKSGSKFTLLSVPHNTVLYSGTLGAPSLDDNSGEVVQVADFSDYDTEVSNVAIRVEGIPGQSYTFAISKNVFTNPFYLSMRSFYGMRCGTAVDLGNGFKHGICHANNEAYHPSSGKSGALPARKPKVGRGWHDAGDYGRYVVNLGFTSGILLNAWDLYGDNVEDISLNFPKQYNNMPDYLEEVKWALDWMLYGGMQDSDGGVWHKQSSEKFIGNAMPENDKTTQFVIGSGSSPFKTSCATGSFGANMAMAARIYKEYDSEFAADALEASKKAFAWLQRNPNVKFNNPDGVVTGEYGDSRCSDEILWNAAELFRATGDDAAENYFLSNYQSFQVTRPGWQSVNSFALWSYALNPRATNKNVVSEIISKTVSVANAAATRTMSAPYRNSMIPRDYFWGSNSVALGYSVVLLTAHKLSPKTLFYNAAIENLHYIFGRNTFSISWVTAVGTKYYMNPHHRPSQSDNVAEPWPGLISGGPNSGREDPISQAIPASVPPAKVWVDKSGSWALNEVAINWNGALVFVLAGAVPKKASGGSTPSPPRTRPPPETDSQTPRSSIPPPPPQTQSQTKPPSSRAPNPTQTQIPSRTYTPGTSQTCKPVWSQCGGTKYKGSTCCAQGSSCRRYNEYWSQCQPVSVGSSSGCAGLWDQCGGDNYAGPKCCQSGSTCKSFGTRYSQCVPNDYKNLSEESSLIHGKSLESQHVYYGVSGSFLGIGAVLVGFFIAKRRARRLTKFSQETEVPMMAI